MPWKSGDIDSGILAVHAALVPNGGPYGEVVLFGGDEHWDEQQETKPDGRWKKTRVYDVATHSLLSDQTQSPDSDVFCAHHVFIGDGRLLIAGGTREWPIAHVGHDHVLAFFGHRRCWLYNPRQRQWVETTPLNRNPGQPGVDRCGGRWYPGLVAMGDGSALALFGHLDKEDNRHRNTRPERFFPSAQSWVNLPRVMAKDGKPEEEGRRHLFFARAWVLPSGKVFSATPLPADFAGQPDNLDGSHHSTAFDPDTGEYTAPRADSPDGVDFGWSFAAVMLPLLPEQYNARFLYWDGAQPRWIDCDAEPPEWVNTAARHPAMAGRNRFYGCMVLLPTGQVCCVGGVHDVGELDKFGNVIRNEVSASRAEIYTPDIDWGANSYGAGTEGWFLDDSEAIHARNYHSTALLLPNGKVWVAGGDHEARSGDPNVVGVKKIELYEPPYIAVKNRIQIQSPLGVLGYGEAFDVVIDRAESNVGRAALIRNGSATHATDNDQRYVGLEILARAGNSITLRAPPDGNIAPPGYYMLWIIDTEGNPCEIARFVRLAHLSCRVIADRSTFSEEEVLALGGGANANFANALYVDFDGFIASELSGTPGFTIEWADGSGVLPDQQIRLQSAGSFTETNPPSPDVPTRITYAFDVVFPTMDAYADWTDGKLVLVKFQLGQHACETLLNLSKSANPYMIDVDPATHNPPWLSTDVRVFKVRPGQARFGLKLSMGGTGPWDYIRGVIGRFRSGAESFTAIMPDGPDTTLDGAYLSGSPPQPTFNFAVARVRYRATKTTAGSVRCFFRICNAAATGLGFDPSTVYRRSPDPVPVPRLGLAGGQLVSIPFVNAERIATVIGQDGADSLDTQPLDLTYDIQSIEPDPGGAEVSVFFGCYLDINTPTPRFPVAPDGDGPYPAADSLPIRDLLRSWHNCIVAEIVFAGDKTRFGDGPGDSDNLGQRNLAIIGLENPGHAESRTAMHTFEVEPSRLHKNQPVFSPIRIPGAAKLGGFSEWLRYPDELFFDWHGLPADAQATLYFSDIDTTEITRLLAARISPPAFTLLDDKTVRFRIGDCAWLPLPGARDIRIPALISISLPDGIVEGQVYRVTIRQVSGNSGRIVGSLTIEMPVTKAAFLRPETERQLSYISHVATTLAWNDRWRPLFDRLVAHLAAKVDALGGNSGQIAPNPDGTGKPCELSGWRPGDPFPYDGFHSGGDGRGYGDGHFCWPGWAIALLVAIGLVAIGVLRPAEAALVVAVVILLIAFCGYAWARMCRFGFGCRLLEMLALGGVTAAGALALGAAGGLYIRMIALALAGGLAALAMLASYLLGCRKGCCD